MRRDQILDRPPDQIGISIMHFRFEVTVHRLDTALRIKTHAQHFAVQAAFHLFH